MIEIDGNYQISSKLGPNKEFFIGKVSNFDQISVHVILFETCEPLLDINELPNLKELPFVRINYNSIRILDRNKFNFKDQYIVNKVHFVNLN